MSRSASFVLKRVPVQRVEDYLQHKTADVPTPEECRQHFTADGMYNVLTDLQKNGFSVVPGWFKLPNDDNAGVLQNLREEAIFERFVLVPENNGVRYGTHSGSGKRLQTKKKYSETLLNWGNIRQQLDNFFRTVWADCDVTYQASRLCSLPGAPVQGVHCDNAYEGDFSQHYKFPVDVMIPISFEDDTFLDIRPSGTNKNVRILLRRGDLLVFRGDVAHRGVENPSDKTHFRLHVYVDHEVSKRATRSQSDLDKIVVRRKKDRTYYVHVGFS